MLQSVCLPSICQSVSHMLLAQQWCISKLWLLQNTNRKLDAGSWNNRKWPKQQQSRWWHRFRSIRQLTTPLICRWRTTIGRDIPFCHTIPCQRCKDTTMLSMLNALDILKKWYTSQSCLLTTNPDPCGNIISLLLLLVNSHFKGKPGSAR